MAAVRCAVCVMGPPGVACSRRPTLHTRPQTKTRAHKPAHPCAQPGRNIPRAARLVIAAETIPQVQLDALTGELHRPLARQARQYRVQRLLLGHALLEGFLTAEARCYLQRLPSVLTQAGKDTAHEV